MVAERLVLDAATELLKLAINILSEHERLNLKEHVDHTKGEFNDIRSIAGESIAAVSSSPVLGILRKKGLEVPQVEHIDKIVDVPVVTQGQVPTSRSVQKAVEVPQVQFLDRVPDVPVATQLVEVPKIVSQDKIQQRTAEQVMDIPVPQVVEEIIIDRDGNGFISAAICAT